MSYQRNIVLIDDDPDARQSLVWVLEQHDLPVESYGHPAELLKQYDPERAACLVLDLKLPEMNGLQVARELARRGYVPPFLIITAHGDVATAVQSMRLGAIDFLEKPFDYRKLIDAVHRALETDQTQRREWYQRREVQRRLASLSPRERQVLNLVMMGKLTKQIARELGISPKTVEVHRSNVTKKMRVRSVAELVRTVLKYNISLDGQSPSDLLRN